MGSTASSFIPEHDFLPLYFVFICLYDKCISWCKPTLHRHYYFVIGIFAFYDSEKEIPKIMGLASTHIFKIYIVIVYECNKLP